MTWKPHIDAISAKLNKANAMLSNIRHSVDQKTLKAIYHTIFESHFYFFSYVWGENFNSTKGLFILQKEALRLMFFYEDKHILTFSLRTIIFLNSMITLDLKTPF